MADEFFYDPKQQYNVKVRIKDSVYTNQFRSCSIYTSLNTPYIFANLRLLIDQNDLYLNEMYGQNEVKIEIYLQDKDGNTKEQVNFIFMSLSISGSRTVQAQNSDSVGNQPEMVLVEIPLVSKKEYMGMNTLINTSYENKKINDIIEDLAKKASLKTDIQQDGINDEVIDQVLIPPMTLYKSIKYLNDTFGIYKGTCGIYSVQGKIVTKNLGYNIRNNGEEFIIHNVSYDKSEDYYKDYRGGKDSFSKDTYFYVFDPVIVKHSGTAKFSILSPNRSYIMKPKDSLFHKIDVSVSDICKKYGLTESSGKTIFDEQTNVNRKKYIYENTGYEKTEHGIISEIGKSLSGITNLTVNLSHDLFLYPFFMVGNAVKFKTDILQQIDLSGKYILRSSTINLFKESNINCNISADLIRSSSTDK